MSDSDIENLLVAASDDADQPLRHSVDDIVRRGRRSLRHRRIATAATTVLTTAAIVGGITTWSSHRDQSIGPATPGQTVQIDPETGKAVLPAPPVSQLSDQEILQRCDPRVKLDNKAFMERMNRLDAGRRAPGALEPGWTVPLKSGTGELFFAYLVSPDRTHGFACGMVSRPGSRPAGMYGRFAMIDGYPAPTDRVAPGFRVPAGATSVLVDVPGEAGPRQALLGADGFYTLGTLNVAITTPASALARVRAYDAHGKKVLDVERRFGELPIRPR